MKILLVHSRTSPFVDSDFLLLSRHFEVARFEWRGKRDILRLRRAVRDSDATLSWFASDHAAMAVMFSRSAEKGSAVIVGGFEVADEKRLRYGTARTAGLRRFLMRYAIRKADLALPVSGFTRDEMLRQATPRRSEVLHNAVDTDRFLPGVKAARSVATVGPVTDQGIGLKGLDTFASATASITDCEATIVGPLEAAAAGRIRKLNPKIALTGELPHEQVRDILARSEVYCQLSARESFGVAVVEAMSCGCVPVTTERGALAEVTGDVGLRVPYGDVRAAAAAIGAAFQDAGRTALLARSRVETMFSLPTREKRLVHLMRSLTTSSGSVRG